MAKNFKWGRFPMALCAKLMKIIWGLNTNNDFNSDNIFLRPYSHRLVKFYFIELLFSIYVSLQIDNLKETQMRYVYNYATIKVFGRKGMVNLSLEMRDHLQFYFALSGC